MTRAQLAGPGGFRRSNPEIHRAWAETAAAFGWITTGANERPDQVAAGRAYQRVNLAATRLGLALQPHSQLLEGYGQAGGAQERLRARLGVGPSETVQMFFRLGRLSRAVPPSPRRRPSDLVRVG